MMKKISEKTASFGEYFDNQRKRLEKAMQNKNTELNVAWREEYDKSHGILSNAIRKGIDAKEKIPE